MKYRGEKILIKNKFKIKVKKGFNYKSETIKKILDKIKNNKKKENDNKNEINEKNNNIEKKEIDIKDKNDIKDNNDIKDKNDIKLNNGKNKEKEISKNDTNNPGIKKKKIKLKLKLPSNKTTEEININNNKEEKSDNIIVIKNNYKRKNIPIINYEGYIPQLINALGISKGCHISNIFGNEILLENKMGKNQLDCLGKEKNNEKNQIKKSEKNGDSQDNQINIFNLIFKIGGLSKKEIIINQYDISGILEQIEDETIIFLMNNPFKVKTKVDIPKHWNKFLNLSFIYSELGYKYLENYTSSKEVGIIKLNKDY